jgi:hypothetical protein
MTMAPSTVPFEAPAPAAIGLRHRCRNPRCGLRLKRPTDNPRRAFCCRVCFSQFYAWRCLVCERDIRCDPLTGKSRSRSSHRRFCGRAHRAEAARFPEIYPGWLPPYTKSKANRRSAHSTGLKSRSKGDRGLVIGRRDWPLDLIGHRPPQSSRLDPLLAQKILASELGVPAGAVTSPDGVSSSIIPTRRTGNGARHA